MAEATLTWQTAQPLGFGGVIVGQTKDLVAVLSADAGNSRNVAGTVTAPGAPWTVQAGASYDIAPGGTHNVTLRYSPTTYQYQPATFVAIGDQTNNDQDFDVDGWGGSETYAIVIADKRTKGGDIVKVTLTFTRTDPPGLFSINTNTGDEIGVKLLDAGEIDWSLDLEELWIMAGIWTLRLGDYHANEYLADLFFDDGNTALAAEGVDRRPTVKLEVKHGGSGSYVTEFIGSVLDEGGAKRENGAAGKVVTLAVSPKLDALNRTMLYKDGAALNPLSYTQNTYHLLTDMISDIFAQVDPSVSVSITHAWEYKAQYGVNPWHYDVTFAELYQYVNELFLDTSYGLETLGDVLRKLAVDWGAIAGMVHSEKAFFRSIFRTQPSNYFTPTHVYGDNWLYNLPVFKYVKIDGANGNYGEEGSFTDLQGEFLNRKALPNFYGDGSSGYSHVLALHTGGEGPSGRVDIYGVRDTGIDTTYRDSHDHQALFWYNYRGDKDKTRAREVRYHGLDTSIDKMMTYDGGDYLILRMKKQIESSITTVEGLKL